MILLKYSKTDGAEFISHLDMLKNFSRIFRRAGIKVAYSLGYNPHPLVYMSAPLGVGIKSVSEYCLVDTDEEAESFGEKFSAAAPRGVRAEGVWYSPTKIGVASDIVKAEYFITGVGDFSPEEVLSSPFIVTDKRGAEKDVSSLVYEIEKENGGLRCVIGFGNGLRVEKFVGNLTERYGGNATVIKTRGLLADGRDFEEILR